ncbi:MAG: hypothetical protein Q4D02_02050 [Clostridia bacterium]|nr:hypothetical protein [Clostridia bacterium]
MKGKNYEMFSKLVREKITDEEISICFANVSLYNDDIFMLKIKVKSRYSLSNSQQRMIDKFKLDGWKIYEEEYLERGHEWFFYPISNTAREIFCEALVNSRRASKKTANVRLRDLDYYLKGMYVDIV